MMETVDSKVIALLIASWTNTTQTYDTEHHRYFDPMDEMSLQKTCLHQSEVDLYTREFSNVFVRRGVCNL